jgi:hypothetical protein
MDRTRLDRSVDLVSNRRDAAARGNLVTNNLMRQSAVITSAQIRAARVRLIVWCLDCRHQVEPDPAEMARAMRGRDGGPGLARAVDGWAVTPIRQP